MEANDKGGGEVLAASRRRARSLARKLDAKNVELAELQVELHAKDREIETLTALNKSQAERIEKLLGDLHAIKKETS